MRLARSPALERRRTVVDWLAEMEIGYRACDDGLPCGGIGANIAR